MVDPETMCVWEKGRMVSTPRKVEGFKFTPSEKLRKKNKEYRKKYELWRDEERHDELVSDYWREYFREVRRGNSIE